MVATRTRLFPLAQAARHLRVPAKWLQSEADADRLPCLKADDAYLFDIETVAKLLLERAAEMKGGAS